jgi:HAD superfamily hydrolase (TIGR01549 family)
MKTYTDFVFDIDGTMLDTERTGVLSLIQTIRELTGREVSYEEAYGFFGVPSARVSEMLGYADGARFGEVWEEHFQELMYLVKPFPGVVETLDALKEQGVRLGLVTSRSQFELDYDPNLKQLLPRFDAVVCSADSVRHKPYPDPMLAYFAKTGAEPGSTLYIGDTMHDYQCGHAAGCDFALADWKKRGMQGIAADYFFTDAEGLRSLIRFSRRCFSLP